MEARSESNLVIPEGSLAERGIQIAEWIGRRDDAATCLLVERCSTGTGEVLLARRANRERRGRHEGHGTE